MKFSVFNKGEGSSNSFRVSVLNHNRPKLLILQCKTAGLLETYFRNSLGFLTRYSHKVYRDKLYQFVSQGDKRRVIGSL